MKDFIGQEVGIGDYFAYPLVVGRSASMAIYKLHSVVDGKVKAIKQDASYAYNKEWKYKKFISYSVGDWRDMTEEEREKVDNKTSVLNRFSERAVLLKNYESKI